MDSRASFSMSREAISPDSNGDHSEEKPGREGSKKGVINRVNRACNHCRKMKMRCVGADDPPCKRCRSSGLECVMEKPGRSGGESIGDERIRSLETQVTSIQSTLSELVSTLRAGMGNPATIAPHSTGFQHQLGHQQTTSQILDPLLHFDNGSDSRSFDVYGNSTANFTSFPPGMNVGFPPRQDVITFYPGSDTASIQSRNQSSPYNLNSAGMTGPSPISAEQSSDAALRQLMSQVNSSPVVPQTVQSKANLHMSLPPSRAGSATPEDDDILGPEKINAPLESMSNMAGLVEAAVERAREERKDTGAAQKQAENEDRPTKKARFGDDVVSGKKMKMKKTHVHAYPDVIDEGIVGEREARELMAIYFAGSSNFIPVYDPQIDTWDSLRKRSPFSMTVIVMVGARVRDGGGSISDIQRLARLHAQRIAVGTLFNPVSRIEAVQSMILLAAFGENGWLPGGHAVRMAIDMGINRSFIQLLRTGMGKGKTPEQLEEERYLVVHSRVWLCLYLIEHQMAYGMGRPAILREDETIHQCRRLLEHPLSITSDARLVSTVELTALRSPLHIELTATPDVPIAEATLRRLKQANADFDAWERYWDRILSDRFGKSPADFFRESLIIQRQYAELFVNSQLLRGIREPHDVINMPEEKRALAIRAMRNAQRCLEICLRGENYRNGLRYAVHYTHVCAAFAASFLIRIARLFPHELNLKKTAKDVEELADVLSDVPAGRYARSLRLILRRARRAKIIPAASVMPSPDRKNALALPGLDGNIDHSQMAFTPSQLINSSYQATPSQSQSQPQSHVGLSPNAILMNASQILNDSPASGSGAETFEFDQLFAQETMEKAGLKFGAGDQLPLFLDGQSLGASQAPTEMTNFVGIENFFLPVDLDSRLAGPSTGDGGQFPSADVMGEEVWW